MKLPTWLIDILYRWAKRVRESRPPDEEIGGDLYNPYMLRWHIVRLYGVFNIYLHQFRHSDDDRARHNHPWWSVSVLLDGMYQENMEKGTLLRREGYAYARCASTYHRVELLRDRNYIEQPAATLFITGPKIRNWGFACPQGFRPQQLFMRPRGGDEKGTIGCDD